ncbi:MAG: hypothetical protein WA823_11935 [Candidatus Acidiferrales bacterium]
MDSVSRPFPVRPAAESFGLRAKLADVRDTVIVIAIHLAFRTALILRRWNY